MRKFAAKHKQKNVETTTTAAAASQTKEHSINWDHENKGEREEF